MATIGDVLYAIKKMNAKHALSSKPVGIDTIMLVMKVSSTDLMPLIKELEKSKQIVVHQRPVNSRMVKYGTVTLAQSQEQMQDETSKYNNT